MSWIIFLIFYFYWLRKRKPYARFKVYNFPKSKFTVRVNPWKL